MKKKAKAKAKAKATPSKQVRKVKRVVKARKLSSKQMQCRHPGCTKRSMGPRYSFMCKRHEDKKPIGRPNLKVLKGGASSTSNGLGHGKASKAPPKTKAA